MVVVASQALQITGNALKVSTKTKPYQILLVFSVTPFKIDHNENQNRSIDKRIWEMKGGTHTKTLAKIQVRGIFRIRDIRRHVLPKPIEMYGDAMLVLSWMSSNMADGNQQEHLLPSFATKEPL